MHGAGIPTVVWRSPILPFLNDTEENISGILDMCMETKVYGVIGFGMELMRLFHQRCNDNGVVHNTRCFVHISI